MSKKPINKIVLAYSGGLDTSVIVKWLQENYHAEIITFTADIGQIEDLEPVRAKAQKLGVEHIFIEDLKNEFVQDFVFPMFRANAIYEGEYLLGTSIARPLIAKRLIEIAKDFGAEAIAHGATGKGNDQVRMELGAYALNPNIQVISPWRIWDLNSRASLLSYCDTHDIYIEKQNNKSPYSMDANALHISYEGDILENPWQSPEESMWRWSKSIADAPNEAEEIILTFAKGDLVAINNEPNKTAYQLLHQLNELGGKHGIGRNDIVENRMVGIKSRGCYETPGGTILLKAHRAIESICLDREEAHLKDSIMPEYAKLIYNGMWYSPERKAMQALIDSTQSHVNGDVRLALHKGNVIVLGRRSDNSLFDEKISTFEDDEGTYDQKDADGYIKINALRFKALHSRNDGSTN